MAKKDPSNAAEKGKYQDFDDFDTAATRPTAEKRDLEATSHAEGGSQSEAHHEGISGKLPTEKSVFKAVICFIGSGLLTIHLFFDILEIVTYPEIFVLFFTLDIISVIVGMAFWKGPADYFDMMFDEQHSTKTWVLLVSMVLSLVFAIILGSYILSILACAFELFACSQFFFEKFPHLPCFGKEEVHDNESTPIRNPPQGL